MSTEGRQGSESQGYDQVVCTLFEGHYHLGLAVLLNSMINAGFKGLVWAGYRGDLPPWVTQLSAVGEDQFELPNGALLKFEKLDASVHFTNYKPDVMLKLIREGVARRSIWYIDPDITVRCGWDFFEQWASHGIAVCTEKINGLMPERHPLRCLWVEIAERAGWSGAIKPLTLYFSGGFVGMQVSSAASLERWKSAIELAGQNGADLKTFMKGTRQDPFYASDQDALNLALMYGDEPISAIGPEGMGFEPGGFTMYHSAGKAKPWRKHFLRSALAGDPPSLGDKHFFACARGPLRVYSSPRLFTSKISIAVASLIGRFCRRR